MSVAGMQARLQVNKPEPKQRRCSLENSGPRQLLLPRPTATALLHLDVIRLTGYTPASFPRLALGHIKALCSLSALKADLFAGCFEDAPFHAVGTRQH